MSEDNKLQTMVVYYDEGNEVKAKYVIIVEENSNGVKFKFPGSDDTFFIPWQRVIKIKRSDDVKDEKY